MGGTTIIWYVFPWKQVAVISHFGEIRKSLLRCSFLIFWNQVHNPLNLFGWKSPMCFEKLFPLRRSCDFSAVSTGTTGLTAIGELKTRKKTGGLANGKLLDHLLDHSLCPDHSNTVRPYLTIAWFLLDHSLSKVTWPLLDHSSCMLFKNKWKQGKLLELKRAGYSFATRSYSR